MKVLSMLLCLFSMLVAATPDKTIERSLRARLARSKMAADRLSFTVNQGVVEWSGQVKISQRKGAATRMAKAAGATRVVNNISVNGADDPKAAAQPNPRKVTVHIPPR